MKIMPARHLFNKDGIRLLLLLEMEKRIRQKENNKNAKTSKESFPCKVIQVVGPPENQHLSLSTTSVTKL